MPIKNDTGYNEYRAGRCYYIQNRTLEFSEDTAEAEIQAFIETERQNWYGQEFSATVTDKTVSIRRAVDSGD